jgi:hypothetical protein
MPSYMVKLQIVNELMVFVDAPDPRAASEKIQDPEGWRNALRYNDDVDDALYTRGFDPKTMIVVGVREMEE